MALHDLNLVSMYADRVALLVKGDRVAMGKPEEVITVEQIRSAYNTEIQVLSHPDSSVPIILPSPKP
jgi:iron complex transport system ATP-binding protein